MLFDFLKSKNKHGVKRQLDKDSIEEIKQFYFFHHGCGMSMYRDDPRRYEQYRLMDDETIEKWRQELLSEDFELLSGNITENTWMTVGHLIRLISSSHIPDEDNFRKLLIQITEAAPMLDKRQRILVLEHFAGRTLSQKDGGIFLIQTQTGLTKLLLNTIDVLSDFSIDPSDNMEEIGWENMQQRYGEVQNAIQKALSTFGIQ